MHPKGVFMKVKIMMISIMVCLVLLTGCINQDNQNGDNNANDNSNNDDNNTLIAGWYLKEIVDYDDPYNGSSASQYGITYSRGNVSTNHYSADKIYELSVRTNWEAPPDYMAAEEEFSVEVTKKALVLNLQLLGYYDTTTVYIDNNTIEPGFATVSKYSLTDNTHGATLSLGQGDTPDTTKTAIFNGTAPKLDNPYGNKFGLIITIQNGIMYGTKYIYEWRE